MPRFLADACGRVVYQTEGHSRRSGAWEQGHRCPRVPTYGLLRILEVMFRGN